MVQILTLLLALIGQTAHGATLPQHSFVWDRARMMSPGQSYFSIQSSIQSGNEVFGQNGGTQNLGYASSGPKTWGQVFQSLNKEERVRLNSFLAQEGLSKNNFALNVNYEMEQERTEFSPIWAYGLTKSWSIAAKLPVTFTKTKIQYKASGTAAFRKFNEERDKSIKSYLLRPLQDGVSQSESQNETGNFQLQSKINLKNDEDLIFSWSQLLHIATAEKRKSEDLVETVTESSSYGLGAGAHMDYLLAPRLWLLSSFTYLKHFSDSTRVENSEGERERVELTAGDITKAQLHAEYDLLSEWRASGGVLFQEKQSDSTEGQEVPFSYKRWEVFKLGMAYRPQQFTQKFSENDFSAELNFYTPIGGESVLTAPTASLEMTLVF